MKIIKRKITVCLRNKCRRCMVSIKEVPNHCQYDVFHALETTEEGMVEKPRRSGKTTELVKLANELTAAGYPVYFMTRTLAMGEHIKKNFSLLGFKMTSLGQAKHGGLVGHPPGYVVADEIMPKELEEVMSFMPANQVVAGYYTSF